MKVVTLARMINKDIASGDYFWACGLIKETRKLWKGNNKKLLHPSAQTIAQYYTEEVER